MAFLPQPALPVATSGASRIRVSTRAAADGVISVSRRRRVYEFLSANTETVPASTTETATAPAFTSPPLNAVSAPSVDVAEVRENLVNRVKTRESAIVADAAKKAASWEAELAALRTPPAEQSVRVEEPVGYSVDTTESVRSYSPFRSSETAVVFGSSDVAAPSEPSATTRAAVFTPPTKRASETAAVQPPVPTQAAPPKATSTPAANGPASTVSDLYSPPSSAKKEDRFGFLDFVEDVVDRVEDVIDSFKPDTKKAEAAVETEEQLAAAEDEAGGEEEEQEDRSFGEVILDAIVEGVPTPGAEEKEGVDKSDLIHLVDTGKVKNLTVTKLRRLLSQNGLKTSGRKAELIARLTSFAKAK